MNIASVFDWFARESLRAAEHTEDPRQREILLKLAVLWEAPHNGAATKHRRNRLRRIRTNALIQKTTALHEFG